MNDKVLFCPVCHRKCQLLDVVDFNKSCEEPKGKFLSLSGVPVYYASCGNCGFCFAPEISKWSLDEFAEKIYNNQYIFVDPEYLETRPLANANILLNMFKGFPPSVRHLDYGGGNGILVEFLRESGWNSISYDPFVNMDICINQLGKFDLITAFEVFEHVPDIQLLMSHLHSLLSPNGLVLFSTLISDGNIRPNERLSWWYASPRNGHISLFSRRSLGIIAQNNGFNFASFSVGFHVFFTKVPAWFSHIIRIQ